MATDTTDRAEEVFVISTDAVRRGSSYRWDAYDAIRPEERTDDPEFDWLYTLACGSSASQIRSWLAMFRWSEPDRYARFRAWAEAHGRLTWVRWDSVGMSDAARGEG
jgi:hypothetical protein